MSIRIAQIIPTSETERSYRSANTETPLLEALFIIDLDISNDSKLRGWLYMDVDHSALALAKKLS